MQSLTLFRTVLFVKDMLAMSIFYRDVLGLPAVDEAADDWKVYSAGTIEIALHQIPQPWCDEIVISDPPAAREESPQKLVFVVHDLELCRDQLVGKGAHLVDNKFLNPPDQLLRCDFLDPEGNVFQLALASR